MDNELNSLALRISKFKNKSTSGKYKYPSYQDLCKFKNSSTEKARKFIDVLYTSIDMLYEMPEEIIKKGLLKTSFNLTLIIILSCLRLQRVVIQ